MWEAVIGDVGVALVAVLDAMRAMKVENMQYMDKCSHNVMATLCYYGICCY